MAMFTQHEDYQITPLWINKIDQLIKADNIQPVIQASSDKIVHHYHSATPNDAIAAVEAAKAAFPSWSKTPAPKRREILFKVADLLTQRAQELGAMQTLETSSAPQYGMFLTKLAGDNIREVASQITNAYTGSVLPEDSATVLVIKQAIGPVLIISPWNSPTILGPRSIAAALAAGCTVVLKGSELCPQTYRMLCQVFADAGLPAGVLNQVVTRREDAVAVTEAIISHKAIRKVEFIGSAAVGSLLGQMCAKYLKPILMELGGKGPAIVCADANLRKAATTCAFGAFIHHGQVCMSTERIIVVKAVAEEFSRLLKEEVGKTWTHGAGSAATKAFADKAHDLLESAKSEGAEFLVGDNSFIGASKTMITPTIVTKVAKSSKLSDAETFGPSATLIVVDDEDEALEVANDSAYGLSGAIWTSDTLRGINLSKRLECGIIKVNGITIGDYPTMPIQGIKGSGWGSNNSFYGIQEFLITKTIMVEPHEMPV